MCARVSVFRILIFSFFAQNDAEYKNKKLIQARTFRSLVHSVGLVGLIRSHNQSNLLYSHLRICKIKMNYSSHVFRTEYNLISHTHVCIVYDIWFTTAFAHHIRLLLEMPRAKYGARASVIHTQFNQYWCGRCLCVIVQCMYLENGNHFVEWLMMPTVLNQNQKGVACNSKWEKRKIFWIGGIFHNSVSKLYPSPHVKWSEQTTNQSTPKRFAVVVSHFSLRNFTSQNPFDRSTHTSTGTKPNAHCSHSAFMKSNHRLVVCREQREISCVYVV